MSPTKQETETETTKLTSEQQISLFEEYVRRKEEADAIEEKLTKARAKVSQAVKSIYDKLGKGPFSPTSVPALAGQTLKVVVRGETYFFRGQSKAKTI